VFDRFDQRVDGGGGSDTLLVRAQDLFIDFTQVPNGRFTGIDRIDTRNGVEAQLKLNLADVLDFADGNTLTVEGDRHDLLQLAGSWVSQGTVVLPSGTGFYEKFASLGVLGPSGTTLLVGLDVDVVTVPF
jgi:hypothetical protein